VPAVSSNGLVVESVVVGGHAGPSSGVVDADPSFWGVGDVHLLPDSPAIDLAASLPGVDPDGTRRDAGALPFDRAYCGPGCDGAIGAPSCVAALNSTGAPATIAGLGSLTLPNDRVILNVDGLPPQTLGYFIASQTADFTPGAGGSSGNLCVGGSPLRFANSILRATPQAGTVSFRAPVLMLPGGGAVQPGETWYFQLWFRDAVGGAATSNFSPALELGF
jgi:hypothetical protein